MGHPDLGCRFTIRPPCVDPGELVLAAVLTPADGSLVVVYQDCVRPDPGARGLSCPCGSSVFVPHSKPLGRPAWPSGRTCTNILPASRPAAQNRQGCD